MCVRAETANHTVIEVETMNHESITEIVHFRNRCFCLARDAVSLFLTVERVAYENLESALV